MNRQFAHVLLLGFCLCDAQLGCSPQPANSRDDLNSLGLPDQLFKGLSEEPSKQEVNQGGGSFELDAFLTAAWPALLAAGNLHGNFCGVGRPTTVGTNKEEVVNTLVRIPSQDALDAYCKRHDLCWTKASPEPKQLGLLNLGINTKMMRCNQELATSAWGLARMYWDAPRVSRSEEMSLSDLNVDSGTSRHNAASAQTCAFLAYFIAYLFQREERDKAARVLEEIVNCSRLNHRNRVVKLLCSPNLASMLKVNEETEPSRCSSRVVVTDDDGSVHTFDVFNYLNQ